MRQVGRSLLADYRPAETVGVGAQERDPHATLCALGREQATLHLVLWHVLDQPAPESADLAPTGLALEVAAVDHPRDTAHRLVVPGIPGAAEVVARALALAQVTQEVIFASQGDTVGSLEQRAHQRRAAAAGANDEHCVFAACPGSRSGTATSSTTGAGASVATGDLDAVTRLTLRACAGCRLAIEQATLD